MTPEDYVITVKTIHDLIMKEAESALSKEDFAMIYPRIITMYEFFRLLRGEAFFEFRPPTPDQQNDFYKMEDEIAKKIEELKNKINFEDERVKHYIEEAQNFYLK